MTQLNIYSKPRGAGDQTSGGRGKLLRATSDLTRVQVLIRETLQNSWDAALDDWVPAYGIHVHQPSLEVRAALSNDVFTGLPDSLQLLASSLSDPEMHVIEIYDRGTTGLDGPVRAGEAAPEGEPNNFNSFVFDIGTTKTDSASGGTFGFGKTATFEVSRAHSVVYWSVCRTAVGDLEHRIIACSLHDAYDQRGTRFTGAHWWGDPNADEIVPLRGPAAQALGERLFKTWFGEDETGTSILVIDPEVTVTTADDAAAQRIPVRTDEQRRAIVDEIVDSLARDAWPKFISTGDEHPPMLVAVFSGDEELDIDTSTQAEYQNYASSLTAIRTELEQLVGPVERPQLPVLKEQSFDITLRPRQTFGAARQEFFGGRPDNLVGILHLMLTVDDGAPEARAPRNQLCMMRSQAELVVKYDPLIEIDLGQLQWTGVFKPTPECDRHFASSEPPTHDSWTPNMAESEVSTYVVRRTLEAIKRKTREFLEGQRVAPKASERSVRDVSTALSSFVPAGVAPDREEVESSRGSSRSKGRRRAAAEPRVLVTDYYPPRDDHTFHLEFQVEGNGEKEIMLTARPSARTSDGRMTLEADEYTLEWEGQMPLSDKEGAAAFLDGARGSLRITTRTEMAIDLELDAGVR
ncbi:hypothetical protein ACUXNS_002386 [Brevibacterium pityocampae]